MQNKTTKFSGEDNYTAVVHDNGLDLEEETKLESYLESRNIPKSSSISVLEKALEISRKETISKA